MTRRQQLLLAAVAMGVTLGTSTLRAAETAPASPSASPAGGEADEVEKHGCKGMNDCAGQGGCATDANTCSGKNGCKGKGGCATVKHDCKGKNECRGQGPHARNECKGLGECAVPIKE